ncbi:ABC transporter permease [Microlunatus speluncae]|uniref:ABC transporter permease n=1 Tax=Microlunatus speluncae TaxID=2594267 RepID=UPI001266453F|nr:ABC transporter permease [Microlunatus speluncae]
MSELTPKSIIEPVSDDIIEPVPVRTGRRMTRGQLILRRFLRNRTAMVGVLVYLIIVGFAVIGPHLYYWDYTDVDRLSFLKAPSSNHWFGTTQSGNDVFALTMRGLQKSIMIGLLVALISTAVAATVGSFAAYFGGWFERGALWVIDLLLVIPSFLIIAIITRGGPQGPQAWLLLVVLLAAFAWILDARVVRSLCLTVKEREYVLAAKFAGLPAPRVIIRHIIPNISSLLIINATLGVGSAILAETGLSFFGFGVQPPDTSLGTLIGQGQRMATTFPWIFAFPAVILVVMVMSINAIGDGLRDALDPNSTSGGRA